MDDKKNCKISTTCKTHWRGVLGLVMLVLAAILTLITLSGAGIFGMFIVGLVLVCHKHMWPMCDAGCDCGCSCCDPVESMVCDITETAKATKSKAKKDSV